MKHSNLDTITAKHCTPVSFEIFQNTHGNQVCLEMINKIVTDCRNSLATPAASVDSIVFITGIGERFDPLSPTADPKLIRVRQALEADAPAKNTIETIATIIQED